MVGFKVRGYHQSHCTDGNTEAETKGILLLKVTKQVSYRSGLASETINLTTTKLMDKEILRPVCTTAKLQ